MLTCHLVVISQSTPEHQGVLLYRQGKYSESIRVLETATKAKAQKKDARLWNFLGLSYLENGAPKRSRSALQKAVKLAPQNAEYRTNLAYAYLFNRQQTQAMSALNKAISIDPASLNAYNLRGKIFLWRNDLKRAESDADNMIARDPGYYYGYILKSEVGLAQIGDKVNKGSTLKDQTGTFITILEHLRKGFSHCRTQECKDSLDEEISNIEAFRFHFEDDRTPEQRIVEREARLQDPLYKPLKIVSKAAPGYTDAARAAGAQGKVVVAILFGKNGKIENLIFIKRLGHGLDEMVLAAVRQITFEPASYNGEAKSVVRLVEYNFSIY